MPRPDNPSSCQTARAMLYVAGWFAGACSSRWPEAPPVSPLLLNAWERGAYAGTLSRILARSWR